MALNINGTTGISGVDGSVSAPAVTGTDSNTGITFPAADTIKFSTGGVERMSITNSGVSGITTGITHARTYRLTSNFTLNSANAYITSNWEYDDTTGAGFLGSGWALPSSGVFSFPATGIYEVKAHTSWYGTSGTNTPYGGIAIVGTTDNFSSEIFRAVAYSSQSDDFLATRYHNVHVSSIFDITDTSNDKFKIRTARDNNYNSIVFEGNSNENNTYVEIIRLGDT